MVDIKNCKRCKHQWASRIEIPMTCPKCKSYLWNKQIDGKCSICCRHFMSLIIHHIDGNHNNNLQSNIIQICVDCHQMIHNPSNEGKNKRIRTRKIRTYISDPIIEERLENLRKKIIPASELENFK